MQRKETEWRSEEEDEAIINSSFIVSFRFEIVKQR